MQNVPTDPESRGKYRAPAGMVFVQGDLSKIELRAQAQFSGDSVMIAAFNLPASDPRSNLYAITGSKIYDLPLEEVASDDKHPAYKLGKRINLAFCYGMQAQEFQNRTRDSAGKAYTLEEAIEFRRVYFDTFPGMAAWIEAAWDATRAGIVFEGRTKLGRRRSFSRQHQGHVTPERGGNSKPDQFRHPRCMCRWPQDRHRADLCPAAGRC